MTFHIVANLDQEALWLGKPGLSHRAQKTISAYSALLAALAPSDDVTVWAHTAVDSERLLPSPGWRPPKVCVGTPPHIDLRWADPEAKAANDRRFALHLATSFGCALPGARVIHSLDDLAHYVAAGGAVASLDGSWVCKAPWSSAGRERVFGKGTRLDERQCAQLARLFDDGETALVFEPWLTRTCDVAICGTIADAVSLLEPHGLVSSERGGFVGIDLAPPPLDACDRDALVATAKRVATELARAGYRGPFGIDGFVYRDGDTQRLHPLCEINARYTFGHVAHALADRIGISTLRFSQPAPHGAMVLVRPSRDDAASVWAI